MSFHHFFLGNSFACYFLLLGVFYYSCGRSCSGNRTNFILTFAAYDLATQCESRRASIRRHTIVGCQSFKVTDSQSVPPSRPQSRQSTEPSHPPQAPASITPSAKSTTPPQNAPTNLSSMDTWTKNSLDEHQWRDKLETDRLSLTLEEIVHIRSVITKAELESLPVGIHIKEDVEKRKLCFLCLRTKFGILSSRGVPCKLCQRTVCGKCYTKMRIPTEHFSNVPVQLLSPSLQNSPSVSNVPSPIHHGNGMDESFPRSLMERLLRTDVDRKVRKSNSTCISSFSTKPWLPHFSLETLLAQRHRLRKTSDQTQAHPDLVNQTPFAPSIMAYHRQQLWQPQHWVPKTTNHLCVIQLCRGAWKGHEVYRLRVQRDHIRTAVH